MMAIKLAMIVMMVGSSTYAPIHMENMNKAVEYPRTQIIEVVPGAPIESAEETMVINHDKTYEQCEREAFERLYEEINKLLDQIPERCEDQFQLQRMM